MKNNLSIMVWFIALPFSSVSFNSKAFGSFRRFGIEFGMGGANEYLKNSTNIIFHNDLNPSFGYDKNYKFASQNNKQINI
jgi:hypothetical protein